MEKIKKNTEKKLYLIILITLILCFLPLMIKSQYVIRVIVMALLYSIVALSINLIVGFCGQLDFGRAAFVGLGAYWSALLTINFNLPFIFCFLSAGFFCAFMGLMLGLLCRKTSFDYLSLITIGFSEIVRLVSLNWFSLTNGAMGLGGIPPPSLFGYEIDTNIKYFYFALFILVVCYITIYRIINSKIGRAFKSIRDNELAAASAGINVPNYKLLNFVIASFFTGIAGSAIVHYTSYISPWTATLDESIYQLQMPILGGIGNLPGSILGAFILIIAPEISRTFYEYRLLFVGFLMVFMMIWYPNGILGKDGIGEKVIGISRFFPQKNKYESSIGGKKK